MISAVFYCKPLILRVIGTNVWKSTKNLHFYVLWLIILKIFVIHKQQLSVTEKQVFSLDTFKAPASNYQ